MHWLCARCVQVRENLPNVTEAKYFILQASPERH
jgi:hypothetical protein